MSQKEHKCVLISDFTIDNLAGYLDNDESLPIVKSVIAPFGQVAQALLDKDMECWKKSADVAVIWTRPESAIESFGCVIDFKKVPIERALEEVDAYSSLLLAASGRVKFVFIPTWVFPLRKGDSGLLDMKPGIGAADILMRMNLRLAENLQKASNIYVLNSQKWIESAGNKAFNPKLWYMGKIAFGNEVFAEAAKSIKSALMGLSGNSKKLIILDLDNILWGGVVGDAGLENLILGGHDPEGEAFADFQKTLKAFANRGILLSIVSKNEESVALEAVNNHPEMVIRSGDFAGWRINWDDKAKNIVDLASDLNLGLESVVFIDDNPAERERVKKALPEVLVPEWPEDVMLYKSALLGLSCFDTPSISNEDYERTKIYEKEQQRRVSKIKFQSVDEWLKTLNIKVRVEELSKVNLSRAAQLLNKTNQMNLATRRLTDSELMCWAEKDSRKVWAFYAEDRFGDLGLIGLVSLDINNKKGQIVDFILSCRVIGRKIEEAMVCKVASHARSVSLDTLSASYVPTAKNKPCLEFWQRSGFTKENDNRFVWNAKDKYALPGCIVMEEAK